MKNTGLCKVVLLVLAVIFTGMDASAENIAKVVDENGQPIAGAQVSILIYASQSPSGQAETAQKSDSLQTQLAKSADEKLMVTTDSNGNFILPAGAGGYKIVSVKKEGYEFAASDQSILVTKSQNADNPVQAVLIQKPSPAFLICSEKILRFKAGNSDSYVMNTESCLISENKDTITSGNSGSVTMNNVPSTNGIAIHSSINSSGDAWVLTLAAESLDGGIAATDTKLYLAPEAGYESKLAIEFPIASNAQEFKKYVYIKAPAKNTKQADAKSVEYVFSRLEIEVIEGKAELIASVQSYSNPDGSRNLHYQSQFQEAQRKEIQARLNKGMEDKSLTPEEIEQMQWMASQSVSSDASPWDFDNNRRRVNKQKEELRRAAEGRTRPAKNVPGKSNSETTEISSEENR
ncbi:MAG: carboxypeptidase-like regulatory domain-containing protein [Anaerohalosphaeraceae bacterium]